MKKILLVICVFFLCGCACAKTARRNNDLLLTLNIGQGKQEVLQIMGNPSRNERYSSGGKETEIWYYRTDVDIYGSEDDNFTPVVFENGKLAGWGRNFYDERIEYQSQIQ